MTYQQAYNKIIDAYFKDEIKPFDAQFCFCGTLCGSSDWLYNREDSYSPAEYTKMELALFSGLRSIGLRIMQNQGSTATPVMGILDVITHARYEDALFAGMCAALEVLKEIHRERGENVDDVPEFTKRMIDTSVKEAVK